ncbi:unnamed protein product [Closterium sp. NIES-65]|nr:unnamed protein product [Closterium sp. NIES-65]
MFSKGEAVEEKRFIPWNYRLVCTPRKDGGLGLICPERRVDNIAIRCVCRLVLKPNSVKKWLVEKAAEMPLGLDTIFAHRSLLDHWEKGSARWKELVEKSWDSPLCKPRAPTNRWEVEQEHLAFNPNIPFRGASPFGNQKGAEALLGVRMGDLIVKARDGTCELKKLAALARELGCREKAKWALRAFNAAPTVWKEMILAKLTGEEVAATVKLVPSNNSATGGFTYWKVGEARGDTMDGTLCDIGDGGHFSPYKGNLTLHFNLRSGVPMFTEGSVFLGPMGDVRTKLLLSAACEGGELISLKGIRKVLADSAGPQEEQRRWEGQRREIEWDRVIEQRDSLVTPRRAREVLIRLHCRNLQVGSRLFFMGVVCPHCQGEETPDHCLLDGLAVQGVADVMRHGLEIMRPGLAWQDLEDLLFMQRSTSRRRRSFLSCIASASHPVIASPFLLSVASPSLPAIASGGCTSMSAGFCPTARCFLRHRCLSALRAGALRAGALRAGALRASA